MDVAAARRRYAEELRARAQLRSEALVQAFTKVPRERFLGPGPWQVMAAPGGYTTTVDADPAHLYRDVLVAINAARFLNNGHPSSLAGCFDALDLQPSERVLHVGCGVAPRRRLRRRFYVGGGDFPLHRRAG
jgi:protein-L-isoaspartate(D-aspartate) O-methyltransferase